MPKLHPLFIIAFMSAPHFCFAQTEDKKVDPTPTVETTEVTEVTSEETTDTEVTPDTDAVSPADGSTPTEGTAPAEPAPPVEAAPPTMASQISGASNITINIRTRLNQIDEEVAKLEDPSPTLLSTIEARKEKLTEDLNELDVEALELAKAEKEFQASLIADFQLTVVTPEQRMQYVTDGKAVYDAMANGFKQSSIARRVDALNQFDHLDENFRGIPEYADAKKQYFDMLEKLVKHWEKAVTAEERKRERMTPLRREKVLEKDKEFLESLEEELGEPVSSAMTKKWIAPVKKSYPMTVSVMKRAEARLRDKDNLRTDDAELEVGVLSDMLTQYWTLLDQSRELMCRGNLAEAIDLLDNNENYREILRLNRYVFPEKYRKPVVDQYSELRKEIQRRQRERRSAESKLTRQISILESSAKSCEAAIEGIFREIKRAKENEERQKRIKAERARLEEERRKAREEARRKREAAKNKNS